MRATVLVMYALGLFGLVTLMAAETPSAMLKGGLMFTTATLAAFLETLRAELARIAAVQMATVEALEALQGASEPHRPRRAALRVG